MKAITGMFILLITCVVLVTGCTSSPAPVPQAPAATVPMVTAAAPPDLVGSWAGTMQGYRKDKGFEDFSTSTITMVVTEQQGRIFAGHYVIRLTSSELNIPFAGVISRDGRTFSIVEDGNGYTNGEITGTGTIELTHVDDAPPFSVAIDTLKKV
ncbi:MAG: hypothetical protein GYA23_05590 [Methanomicrobiales archaeon]|nr:hypothetical protein [Methanomicrobiales archaeon]